MSKGTLLIHTYSNTDARCENRKINSLTSFAKKKKQIPISNVGFCCHLQEEFSAFIRSGDRMKNCLHAIFIPWTKYGWVYNVYLYSFPRWEKLNNRKVRLWNVRPFVLRLFAYSLAFLWSFVYFSVAHITKPFGSYTCLLCDQSNGQFI